MEPALEFREWLKKHLHRPKETQSTARGRVSGSPSYWRQGCLSSSKRRRCWCPLGIRSTQGHDLEFSVDIRATHVTPPPETSKDGCRLDTLVECKQRTRSVVWLFLPDVSSRGGHQKNDLVVGVDAFSKWSLTDLDWATAPSGMHTCYKGIEVDMSTGHVESAELRHGLLQLQFAMPVLLRARLDNRAISLGVSDNTPLLFSAVLLTNAPLFVARRDLSAATVERVKDVSELGQQVSYLLMRLPPSRDYFQHCQRHFAGFKEALTQKGIKAAEEHRKSQGIREWYLPSSFAARVSSAGEEIEAFADFSSVVICGIQYFRDLMTQYTALSDRVGKAAVLQVPKYLRP